MQPTHPVAGPGQFSPSVQPVQPGQMQPAPSYQQQIQQQYNGLPPSGAQTAFPQQSQTPPPQLAPGVQRKVDAATGRGLRVDPNTQPLPMSGERITLRGPDGIFSPCRNCGVNPCSGLSWIFDGVLCFKCDNCGRPLNLGKTEEAARENHLQVEGLERADYNRRRLTREDEARMREEMNHQLQHAQQERNPYYSALNDQGFVMEHFMG